jgi:chromosome segregation ATPase
VLGRSPGLVHIPEELNNAIDAAQEFENQGSQAIDAVQETVADLTDEQKKALDAMLEQHKAISRIADAMGLAVDQVQDYADAWNDAKQAAEEAAQARKAAQQEAETKADFVQGIERDIAKASTTDDLASKLLDLAFDKQDDLKRAVDVFGVDSPYNQELQQAKDLINEKYDLLEQQARQDVTNAANGASSTGADALQQQIETLLQYSSAGDYLTPVLDKIRQQGALVGASAVNSLATLKGGAGGLTISIGGVSIALGDGTSEADLSAEIGNAIVGSLKQQGVRLAAG